MPKNSVSEYDTTASNNTDVGGVSTAEGQSPGLLNNGIRELMAQIKKAVANQGSDIASASSTDIGAATGQYVKVTGTTTITALGTVAAGTMRWVEFTGALTLTHNATSLKLPTSANITTAAGDTACFVSLGSGNWKCLHYIKLDGTSVTSASTTVKGSVRYATDAEFIAQTETAAVLTPSNVAARPRIHVHKNGTAQGTITGGGGSDVKLTWSTESADVGSYFASDAWTPPSGTYLVIASARWDTTNAVDNEALVTKIYVAGSAAANNIVNRGGASGIPTPAVYAIVTVNGSQAIEVYVNKGGAGDGQINGTAAFTYFMGFKL